MNPTRRHPSPSTPHNLPPAITPAPTPAPESPIAPARPAPRRVTLTCRPTIGQTIDSPSTWTATIVWGDRERDPKAPEGRGLGRVESAALETLFFDVRYMRDIEEITDDEVDAARMAIYARLCVLESLRNPALAADLMGLSALVAEQLATGTMGVMGMTETEVTL